MVMAVAARLGPSHLTLVTKLFVAVWREPSRRMSPEPQEATASSCKKLSESEWKTPLPPQSHN